MKETIDTENMMIGQNMMIGHVGLTDVTATTTNPAAKWAGTNTKEAKTIIAETTTDPINEVAAEVLITKGTEDTEVQDRRVMNEG